MKKKQIKKQTTVLLDHIPKLKPRTSTFFFYTSARTTQEGVISLVHESDQREAVIWQSYHLNGFIAQKKKKFTADLFTSRADYFAALSINLLIFAELSVRNF